jgi:hypothetical protein
MTPSPNGEAPALKMSPDRPDRTLPPAESPGEEQKPPLTHLEVLLGWSSTPAESNLDAVLLEGQEGKTWSRKVSQLLQLAFKSYGNGD